MPIVDHKVLIPENQNSQIWRYLNLEKFESVLKTESLFFCRVDKFSDPFEGSVPKLEFEHRIKKVISRAKENGAVIDEEEAKARDKGVSDTHINFMRSTIASCWHINSNESDNMWQLYLKSNEGVAIQSRVGLVSKAFQNTKEGLFASKVRYIDYEKDIWGHAIEYPIANYNFFTALVHKRIEFKHEQEFRILGQIQSAFSDENYWESQDISKGKFVALDLRVLVERLVMPPTIDKRGAEKLSEICSDYGFQFNIARSRLSEPPYY